MKFKITIFALLIISLYAGCSSAGTADNDKKGGDKAASAPAEAAPQPVKPAMGEVECKLPKGWIPLKQQPSAAKDVESLSFIRKIDEGLWANPGVLGTSELPMMNLMITRRPKDAPRADLEPKTLGNNLVKQGFLLKLVEASEIKIANLDASKVVGDTAAQGRVYIIMLPHNSYLYKWTLFNTKPNDTESAAALDALLSSASFTGK